MAEPFQPIPESTQVHVDRLIGARLGEVQVLERLAEGRFGSLYKGAQATRPVLIEVLRAGRAENENDVRAVNSIGAKGVVNVSAFGQVPDGRYYRVMDWLDGESLDQRLQKHGKLPAPEALKRLEQVAEVLEAAHAWAIPHGSIGPSSVFVVGDAVKVIDFGIARAAPTAEDDQRALGALGFSLLMGKELEGAPPPASAAIDDAIDRLLRELFEKRLANMSEARKELRALLGGVENTARATPKPVSGARRSAIVPVVVALLILGGTGGGFAWWYGAQGQPADEPLAGEEDLLDDEALDEPEEVEPTGAPQPVATPRPTSSFPRPQKPPPSAAALQDQIRKLESALRDQTKPGDDIDQALFVLNKQRLRLTGNDVSLADRKDVAHQLVGWKRSYLKKKKR